MGYIQDKSPIHVFCVKMCKTLTRKSYRPSCALYKEEGVDVLGASEHVSNSMLTSMCELLRNIQWVGLCESGAYLHPSFKLPFNPECPHGFHDAFNKKVQCCKGSVYGYTF